MRELWAAERVSFDGDFYSTRDASIYDRPATPVPIYVAAGGPVVVKFAGRVGEGFICTSGKGMELDPMPPSWSPTVASNGSAVPLRRLLKSLGRTDDTVRTYDQEPLTGAIDLLQWRAYLDALSGMEERGLTMAEAALVADAEISEAGRRLKVPMTLGLPGIAPRYRRLVRRLAEEVRVPSPAEQPPRQPNLTPTHTEQGDPPDVLRLMVAHNAAGDNSVGIVSATPIPDAAFVALADLERYWVDSSRTHAGIQPAKEERLRARLPRAATRTDPRYGGMKTIGQCALPDARASRIRGGRPLGRPARRTHHPTKATEITIVRLPGFGHAHNYATARRQLWSRVATWVLAVDPGNRTI